MMTNDSDNRAKLTSSIKYKINDTNDRYKLALF
jgi:hypothetical protein